MAPDDTASAEALGASAPLGEIRVTWIGNRAERATPVFAMPTWRMC